MRNAVSGLFDRLRGNGAHSVTTPPMDGALKPNRALDDARVAACVPEPDHLVLVDGDVLFSTGAEIRRLAEPDRTVHSFDAAVTAMAASPGGVLAVGLETGGIHLRGGPRDGAVLGAAGTVPVACPTAILFENEDSLVVCDGSDANAPSRWRRDLMQRNARGSVRRFDRDGSGRTLASGLAFPNGLLPHPEGGFLVAEAWASRLLHLREGESPRVVLDDLPGYPARLSPRQGGGAFMAVLAPRNQLVEFVLKERAFREAMMRDVAEEFWMAPSLRAPRSFLEPMQGGALKQLGRLKPWAPTRSFGLVIGLDAAFRPVESWHSRADGTRHGVTACLQESDGTLLVAARGGDVVLALDPNEETVR